MRENARDQAALNDAKASSLPDAKPSDKKPCPYLKRLRLGVFFDGTNNNKYRDGPKADEDAFSGGETNVARLHKIYIEKTDEEAARFKRYLIGNGAVEGDEEPSGDDAVQPSAGKAENVLGLAFGKGAKQRLNIAYAWVKAKCAEPLPEAEKVVDIYGFSRGAVLARTFANLVNQALKKEVENVRVRFLGVFDSVGSFGAPGSPKNRGQNLGLDSADVDAWAHFTARHEYRHNFPLSELPGADKEYPGVHSDVGGGYEDQPSGKRNHLAYITLEDMYLRSLDKEKPDAPPRVEMDPPELPAGLPALREKSATYGGLNPEAVVPPGVDKEGRDAFFGTYVHVSAKGSSINVLHPNRPERKHVRRRFRHKKLKLAGKPPNFSWK